MDWAIGLHLKAPTAAEWDRVRWPHFLPWEFACRCAVKGPHFCEGEFWHDPEFFDAMERLRERCGHILVINSGHRCKERNADVGGAAESQHLTLAVDVRLLPGLSAQRRQDFEALARIEGFTGIGRAVGFIHLDRREKPATWDYGAAARDAWGM